MTVILQSNAALPRIPSLLLLALLTMPAMGSDKKPAAPRVDVQASLCGSPEQTIEALRLKSTGAPSDVWLFDDASLSLFNKGLRIRLRPNKKGAELTLKAADQDCAQLAPGVLPAGEGKCEYDAHGERIAGALSLSRTVSAAQAAQLAGGQAPVADALSEAQVRYLQSVPGVWPLPVGLRALGPTRVSSYAAKPYVVDISELPGGERFIEISRKGPLTQAAQMRSRMNADLTAAGVTVCTDQSAQAVNKLKSLLKP